MFPNNVPHPLNKLIFYFLSLCKTDNYCLAQKHEEAWFADVWNNCAPDTELWAIVWGIRPIYGRLIHTKPVNTWAPYSVTSTAGQGDTISDDVHNPRKKHAPALPTKEEWREAARRTIQKKLVQHIC